MNRHFSTRGERPLSSGRYQFAMGIRNRATAEHSIREITVMAKLWNRKRPLRTR